MALNLLLPSLAGHEVRIGLTERVGRTGAPAGEHPHRQQLRSAEQTLPNEVFFPLVDRAGWPDDGRRFLTFAEIERHRHIPTAPLPDPNAPAAIEEIRGYAPDLILTIRYGAILRAATIAIPRFGVLNLHSGLLPDYRGVLASFRALAAGELAIGCTLHFVSDASIDTGAIVGTARIPVIAGKSLLWHVLGLYPAGVRLVVAALSAYDRGAPPAADPQPPGKGAYFSYPQAADWEAFRRRGWNIADPGDLEEALRHYLPREA